MTTSNKRNALMRSHFNSVSLSYLDHASTIGKDIIAQGRRGPYPAAQETSSPMYTASWTKSSTPYNPLASKPRISSYGTGVAATRLRTSGRSCKGY